MPSFQFEEANPLATPVGLTDGLSIGKQSAHSGGLDDGEPFPGRQRRTDGISRRFRRIFPDPRDRQHWDIIILFPAERTPANPKP
jgi:hypothetical protein